MFFVRVLDVIRIERHFGGLGIFCAMLVLMVPAVAEPIAVSSATEKILTFDIPADSLESVLMRFSVRAGISLTYEFGRLQGQRSPGLVGSFTVNEGFLKLLSGSGLTSKLVAVGSYILIVAQPALSGATPIQQIGPTTFVDDSTTLPPMIITGNENISTNRGFLASSTNSATRTDTPISEIPQSIQVVTQDVLTSQQVQSVEEAVRNVSGVTINRDEINGSNVYVRNFLAPVRINGLKLSGSPITPLITPIAAIERVDVLRGSNSIVANGAMEPGGVVNIETKQPQARELHELTIEIGSLGHKRAALDLAGALSEDQRWTQRLILSANGDHRTVDNYDGGRDLYVAPSVGYQHNGSSIVVGMSYQRTWLSAGGSPYVDLSAQGLQGPFVGIKGRADDGQLVRSMGLSYDIKQKLSEEWTLQSKGNYLRQQLSRHTYSCIKSVNPEDGVPATACLPYASEASNYGWTVENSVRGEFHTGPVRQAVVAGMAYNDSWQSTVMAATSGTELYAFPLSANLPPIDRSGLTPAFGRASQHFSNMFLQDQLSWGRWHLLANIGYASAWSSSADVPVPPRYSKPTYNFGLTYRLNDGVTAHVNRFKSFEAGQLMTNASLNGGPVGTFVTPVSEGQSIEVGLKFNLLDDRLLVTAAVFKASLTNVFQDLGNNSAGVDAIVLLPNTSNRGVEFDVTGRIMRGWNITASYSDITFKTAAAPMGLTTFSPFPRRQVSIWSTYDLQDPDWHGWGYGIGLMGRSGYATNINYTMGTQLRMDTNIHYRLKKWSFILGIKNLFDRRLYRDFAAYGKGELELGRTVLLTSSYNF
jgi:iron complex outermembrane receptor protein